MPSKTSPHYLSALKEVLDDAIAPRPLHLCVEAAHPKTLGRPADIIQRVLLKECFDHTPRHKNDGIHIHFTTDRLSLPTLDGHVVAIGGPRSNVISRIAMEYEVDFETDKPYYRRHPGACFPMEYTHIHKYDYDERLLADMNSLDDTSRDIIHYYYKGLGKRANEKDTKTNLFSVNRRLHRKFEPLPSLSAEITEEPKIAGEKRKLIHDDYVIYDHVIETLLPNVFSEKPYDDLLVVVHGLRNFGTFAGLLQLNDEDYLKGLRERLQSMAGAGGPKMAAARPFQTGWTVCRPLPATNAQSNEEKEQAFERFLNALNEQPTGRPSGFEKRPAYLGEQFASAPHGEPKKPDKPDSSEEASVPPLSADAAGARVDSFRKAIADIISERTYRPPVTIDRIDEQQILDAMSLPRDKQLRRNDIYVLGCFERKKTVYTQQTRALTLIHALYKAGKITPKTKIAIVGGGVSGMSAAIAAAEAGARVALVEKEKELIWVQGDCEHRWLHPRFYDWPQLGSGDGKTDLPIEDMNWTEDRAKDVLLKLEKQFKDYKAKANKNGDRTRFSVYLNWPVRMVLRDRQNGRHVICCRGFKDVEGRVLETETSALAGAPLPTVDFEALTSRSVPPDRVRAAYRHLQAFQTAASDQIRRIRPNAASADEPVADPENLAQPVTRLRHDDNDDIDPDSGERSPKWLGPYEIVDCDILIFATGFGAETPGEFDSTKDVEGLVLNGDYWSTDEDRMRRQDIKPAGIFEASKPTDGAFIVSGAGDGALIDILRLCIRQFSEPSWHRTFMKRISKAITPDRDGSVWANRRDTLVFADNLRRLFEADLFRLTESEPDRLRRIEDTMMGFDVDAFLDEFDIDLNNVQVYNVANDPQPFWPDSALPHRLLVWCLYKKNRVRFIRGSIVEAKKRGTEDKPRYVVSVRRTITGKLRQFDVRGIVIRHGVGTQAHSFLSIPGLLYGTQTRSPESAADDGARLVSLLRLSNTLHPETEKFFRHTIKHVVDREQTETWDDEDEQASDATGSAEPEPPQAEPQPTATRRKTPKS